MHVYVYVYMYVHMKKIYNTYICIYIYMYIYIYTCVYIYTYIHRKPILIHAAEQERSECQRLQMELQIGEDGLDSSYSQPGGPHGRRIGRAIQPSMSFIDADLKTVNLFVLCSLMNMPGYMFCWFRNSVLLGCGCDANPKPSLSIDISQ